MFSLSLATVRPASKVESLSGNPWYWSKQAVLNFLDSKNSAKSKDRAEIQQQLAALRSAIGTECRDPYHSVEDVLQADLQVLPIQLRAYRELYEYMLVWLG